MRRLPLPLLVLMILIAFPVTIPIGIVSWMWDRRRMRAVAERTHCERCGATLGVAALQSAEAEWTKRVAALQDARPTMRFRMIRSLWAVCAVCGAEFNYDFHSRIFHCRQRRARRPGPRSCVDDEASPWSFPLHSC
jgi:hypothetical protein